MRLHVCRIGGEQFLVDRQLPAETGECAGGIAGVMCLAGLVLLIHTEVAEAVEGQGLGSRLVRGALDDIRARGLKVAPVCPFVLSYLERHPEYADLVESNPPRWE